MKKRIIAFLIDLYIIYFITFFGIGLYLELLEKTYFYPDMRDIYVLISFLLVFLKDLVFKNASIGKKIMKIEVLKEDNSKPNQIILILRNITSIFWPVEFLIIIFYGKRLSDFIFHTKVVPVNK